MHGFKCSFYGSFCFLSIKKKILFREHFLGAHSLSAICIFFLIFSTLLLYQSCSWLFSLPLPLRTVFEQCEFFPESWYLQVVGEVFYDTGWGRGLPGAVGFPGQILPPSYGSQQQHVSFTHTHYSPFPQKPCHPTSQQWGVLPPQPAPPTVKVWLCWLYL